MVAVSVVVPMRDMVRFVGEAVGSLLAQEGVELEVLVVDDGSRDGSRAAVERIADGRLRLLPGPERGVAAAVNAGLAAARGRLLCRCDADDLYPPGRLERQAAWLAEHPEFGVLCGSFLALDHRGRTLCRLAERPSAQEITGELRAGETPTHLNTFLFRREALAAAGALREWFASGEDIDLQLRLGAAARVWYDPAPCYLYRLHEGSLTHTQGSALRTFYEATARSFARQRRERGRDDLDEGRPPPLPAPTQDPPGRAEDQLLGFLVGASWQALGEGRRLAALRLGLEVVRRAPGRLRLWRNLAVLGAKCALPRGRRR